MKNLIYVISVWLVIVGCNARNTNTDGDSILPPAPPHDTSAMVDSVKKRPPIKEFKGFYIYGNEVNTFRDCEAGQTYWLDDSSQQLSFAYQKVKGYLSYPYESVYAEIEGYLKGKSTEGYAAEYPNTLVVTKVKEIKQKSFMTACFDFDFIGLGNEPFWSLEIIPSEKIIAFKDVASEKLSIFPYDRPSVSGNKHFYQLSNEKGETLNAVFTKENCNDGMSDRNYHYSAEITVNKKHFTGCAIRRGDKF